MYHPGRWKCARNDALRQPPEGKAAPHSQYPHNVDRHYSIILVGPTSGGCPVKISQKGLYALKAMTLLARRFNDGAIRIRDIAYEEALPEKFLELILLELKNARMVESVRGAKGGYRLRRPPSEIRLAEIIRLIDGPLAPFADAEQLRSLIDKDQPRRALYRVFLDVRDAAAKIRENTTLADILNDPRGGSSKSERRSRKKKQQDPGVISMP